MTPSLQEIRTAVANIEEVLSNVDNRIGGIIDGINDGCFDKAHEVIPMLARIQGLLEKVTG